MVGGKKVIFVLFLVLLVIFPFLVIAGEEQNSTPEVFSHHHRMLRMFKGAANGSTPEGISHGSSIKDIGALSGGGPAISWNKTFGGSGNDTGWSVQQTNDGGYILTGDTQSYDANGDVYLIKTNSNGNLQWEKTFGGSSEDGGSSVKQTTDGGYIIAGYTESYGTNGDVYLIKTYSNGNKQWQKTFGGADWDEGSDVQQTMDGGYIITGYTSSYGAGESDFYLIKTDSDGNVQWQKTFGGAYDDESYSVQQASDGGYIITGYTNLHGVNKEDVYLIKTYSNGTKQWERKFGGTYYEEGYSVQQTNDGGYIVVSTRYFDMDSDESEIYLVKTYSNGNKQWEKTFGGADEYGGVSVQQTIDGGYIISGGILSDGGVDGYLLKTDSNGNKQWEKPFGGADDDIGFSVQQTSDRGYIIAGSTLSYGASEFDVYLVKTNPDGVSYCGDSVKNGDETDVDCGGSCSKCIDGENCLSNYDCTSSFCNVIKKCGCIDYDTDEHQDIKCGGDDCNDNNGSTIRCPVLLVHGYASDPGIWTTGFDFAGRLRNDGFNVFLSDYSPGDEECDAMLEISFYSSVLQEEIKEILKQTSASKVDIIAHSMGGLISRYYTQSAGYKGNVRHLIMMGTPNHGTFLLAKRNTTSYLLAEMVFGFSKSCPLSGIAGLQMTPGSKFLSKLNYGDEEIINGTNDIIEGSIDHNTLGGYGWDKNEFLSKIINLSFPEMKCVMNDGVVEINSLKLKSEGVYFKDYNQHHFGLYLDPGIYSTVKDILLGTLPKQSGTLDLPPEEVILQTQEVLYKEDTLSSGQTHYYNVSIHYANTAIFTLGWLEKEADLDLTIKMPNNTLINGTYPDLNITYYPSNTPKNDTIKGYVIGNPQEGEWQLIIGMKEGIKVKYFVTALLDTDLRISISTDKLNYGINEPINISVNMTNFGEPLLNSEVKSIIKRPDNIIENITLYDDGTHGDRQPYDGSYFNTYNNTSLIGIYEVTAMANGTLNKTPYYRQTMVPIEVYEPVDVYLSDSDIYFSDNTPNEGQEIMISALVHNAGNLDLKNISVEFYDDDPSNYGKIIGRDLINLSANSSSNADALWNASRNSSYIFVLVSPFNSFLEENYSNNIANRSITVKEKQLSLFSISLTEGWNLVSSPLNFTNITEIFNPIQPYFDSMFYYDEEEQEFVEADPFNSSEEFDLRYGAWIKVSENVTLDFAGREFSGDEEIPLSNGWNLIGHPSLNSSLINESLDGINYSIIYSYNGSWSSYSPLMPDSLNTLQYFAPGQGYWVKVN